MRRLSALVLVAWSVTACDALIDAFEAGYDFGYGTVDAIDSALEERRATVQAWNSACDIPVETEFDDAAQLAAADEHCRDRSGVDAQVEVCTDPGEEPGSHPGRCDPYHKPLFFFVGEYEYRCPEGVSGGRWCLCCDRGAERVQGCGLRGDVCETNADCCEGGCSIDVDGVGECL